MYVILDNLTIGAVIGYEPETNADFPDTPVTELYAPDYIERLVAAPDGDLPPVGYIYDFKAKTFSAPVISAAPLPDLPQALEAKCEEINAACNAAIIAGFDYGDKHYSLTEEDQINLSTCATLAGMGRDVAYHADGEECRVYSAAEFAPVGAAGIAFKAYHTTYCNLLKFQVRGMTDVDAVMAVRYGDTGLDGGYLDRLNEVMALYSAPAAGDSHE